MAKYVYYRNGAQGDAYYSLIASGRNAWYPHYNAGKRAMQDGELAADGLRARRRLLHERRDAHVAR